ncbi:MAG: hypothetical protein AB1894_15710 [Chloroflexota bacterium]
MNENDLDPESELIAEKLRRMVDNLKADNAALRVELAHLRELTNHRLAALEASKADHENRIRSLQDGVTTFKTWSGLASGGSSILSIIAFVKALFGIP